MSCCNQKYPILTTFLSTKTIQSRHQTLALIGLPSLAFLISQSSLSFPLPILLSTQPPLGMTWLHHPRLLCAAHSADRKIKLACIKFVSILQTKLPVLQSSRQGRTFQLLFFCQSQFSAQGHLIQSTSTEQFSLAQSRNHLEDIFYLQVLSISPL